MKYLSLCSGIEAATTAWHPLGWGPIAFSEIERFPAAVLKHHYPDVPNHGDMTQFKTWPDYAIDILVGGTPCQSFSVAGLADPRGNLMLTFGAIAARYRPRWLVWENVPGVLSSEGGREFASFLGLLTGQQIEPPSEGWQNSGILSGIDSAYGIAYRVLDAQYVRVESHPRAVPQRRRRVFVVGYLGDWRRAAAVLFERESLCGHPAPCRRPGQSTAPTLASRTRGGGGLGTDFDCDGGVITHPAVDVAPTLRSGGNKTGGDRPPGTDVDTVETLLCGQVSIAFDTTQITSIEPQTSPSEDVAHSLKAEGFDASEDGTGRGTPLVPIAFQSKASPSQSMNPGVVAPALDVGKSDGMCVAFQTRIARNGRGQPEEVCPTLNGSDTGDTGDSRPVVAIQCNQAPSYAVRRLTPLECERLQGFPDDYTRIPDWDGWRDVDEGEDLEALRAEGFKVQQTSKGAWRVNDPDGPRYKALGNSMAVNVMRYIGDRIALVEKENP